MLYQSCGTGGVFGGVGGASVGGGGGLLVRVCKGVVMLCLCELRVWIICVNGRSRYMYSVPAPSVQSCCTLSISASYHIFVCSRYRKSGLVCVDLSRHHPLL